MPSTDVFIKWKSYLFITDIWIPASYVSTLLKNKRLKERITSRWHCKVNIRPNDPLGAFFAFGDETVEKSITTEPQRVRGTTSTDPSKCVKSVFISVLKTVVERHTMCEKQVGKSEQVSWVLGMFVEMSQS